MSSYRRHATHKDAVARARRQILRHRQETFAEPFPDGSMYFREFADRLAAMPLAAPNPLPGMVKTFQMALAVPVIGRKSYAPVKYWCREHPPTSPNWTALTNTGYLSGEEVCAACHRSLLHLVEGCTGAWAASYDGTRLCSDCGETMYPSTGSRS